MPRTRKQLTAGEWAVLALIREAPAHGFALARALEPDGEVGRVWALRRPLVYRALETLERMRLVEAVDTVPSRSGPRRTIFATTPSGKRMLAKWLREPVTHVRDARSLLMLKLLFLARRDADPRRLLVAQRDQFSSLVAKPLRCRWSRCGLRARAPAVAAGDDHSRRPVHRGDAGPAAAGRVTARRGPALTFCHICSA